MRLLAANRKLSLAVLFFISSFLFLLVPSLSAQEKKLDPFTISYASVSGTRGPLWIAQDLGLFAKYGLDVNLVYIASGVISVNALLSGSVDIIAASGSSVVSAAARGAPHVIIASLGHIAYKLVALPSITTVQGLKGKIIGSSRIGAGTDYALKRLLPKLGLTPGKDVQLIPTGISESDRRLLMMLQGKIDATLATEDNLLQLGARGAKLSVLADLYDNRSLYDRERYRDQPATPEGSPPSAEGFYHGAHRRNRLWTSKQGSNHADLPQVLEDRGAEAAGVDS